MARYWSARVDENHGLIRDDFKAAGWRWVDVHRIKGFCDGVTLSPSGRVYLIEVKRLEGKKEPKASRNANQSTKDKQAKLAAEFPIVVLTSVEEAREWRNRMEYASSIADNWEKVMP